MVGRYIKTAEQHLREVVASHQRDTDARLPIFLPAYRTSTYDTTRLTPASLVFRRELRVPCDLLFVASPPPDKEWPTVDHVANLVDHLHDVHNCARWHLKLASNRMKTRYARLTNCAVYHESHKVRLYHSTHTKGKSPKPQSTWEGSYKVVTRVNDVVYRIQRNPRSRMVLIHLDRLAHYQGSAWNEFS
jgi:hypothetical protein